MVWLAPTSVAMTTTYDLAKVRIFHITDVANLAGIVGDGCLYSDDLMTSLGNIRRRIGYSHIKERRRRMQVPCCGRMVSAFVPFYYCPRSPMLFTLNKGNVDGCPPGCQTSIVHLVSTVQIGINVGHDWALADESANSNYPPNFYNNPARLDRINWSVVQSDSWGGQSHIKQAEFLVADTFPVAGITHIGCHSNELVAQVSKLTANLANPPTVRRELGWYY
jgi:hypothetical protein